MGGGGGLTKVQDQNLFGIQFSSLSLSLSFSRQLFLHLLKKWKKQFYLLVHTVEVRIRWAVFVFVATVFVGVRSNFRSCPMSFENVFRKFSLRAMMSLAKFTIKYPIYWIATRWSWHSGPEFIWCHLSTFSKSLMALVSECRLQDIGCYIDLTLGRIT